MILNWLESLLPDVDPCIRLLLERDYLEGLEDRVGIELIIEAGGDGLEEHLKWNQYGLLPARARDLLRDLADKHVADPLVENALDADPFNLPSPPPTTPYLYLTPEVNLHNTAIKETLAVLIARGWVVEVEGKLALPTILYLYALKQRAMWSC